MEDHVWCERAAQDRIPFASLRTVIDAMNHDIVPAAAQFPWRGATAWQLAGFGLAALFIAWRGRHVRERAYSDETVTQRK